MKTIQLPVNIRKWNANGTYKLFDEPLILILIRSACLE